MPIPLRAGLTLAPLLQEVGLRYFAVIKAVTTPLSHKELGPISGPGTELVILQLGHNTPQSTPLISRLTATRCGFSRAGREERTTATYYEQPMTAGPRHRLAETL